MKIGETFNEASTFNDPVTAKLTRHLTCTGLYNQTPTYHLNAAFSADSRQIILASAREGGSAILRADVESGDLTVLALTDGIGDYSMSCNLGMAVGRQRGGPHEPLGHVRSVRPASGRSKEIFNCVTRWTDVVPAA